MANRSNAEHAFQHILEFARADQSIGDPHAFSMEHSDYTIRTKGGEYEAAQFAWTEQILADLDELREPEPDPSAAARIGSELRAFVAQAGWAQHEQTIVDAVEHGAPVALTIRSAAAELYALPWELMTIKATGQHLGELPDVLIRYEWPGSTTQPEQPAPRLEGGRIVLAWSAAGGAVPVDSHVASIDKASQAGHARFHSKHDVLGDVSLFRLTEALKDAARPPDVTRSIVLRDPELAKRRDIAILHILCHGVPVGDSFGLAFNKNRGPGQEVIDARRLRQLIAPHAPRIRLVVLSVCDSGNVGEIGNHLGSLAQALHRAGVQAVIASRFPLAVRASEIMTETFYNTLLGDLQGLERAFLDARNALAEAMPGMAWASLQLYARAEDTQDVDHGDDTRPVVFRPYRGLLPYQAKHQRFFFGRDEELTEVVEDLIALEKAGKPRFLVVAGASGTGKSSLVLGAVIPTLVDNVDDNGEHWEYAVMRPGHEPMNALNRALIMHRVHEGRFLLVVDQFEELFTHGSSAKERNNFVKNLWTLAGQDTGITCIITLRVDFLGQCGEIVVDDTGLRLDSVAYDEAHRVFIAQMRPEQLVKAIVEPARMVGLRLQGGLDQIMIDEVEGEPGALPLLAYTLDRLWKQRSDRELVTSAYKDIGGVIGALQRKADAVVADLSELERKQARRLLVRLVGIDERSTDTRRRVDLSKLAPPDRDQQIGFESVVAKFVQERLLVRSESGGEAQIEVAHEALIRKWQLLRTWLDQDRDKLAELNQLDVWVKEWNTHNTLLQDERLGYALNVQKRHGDDLDSAAQELIQRSLAHKHDEEERKRKDRRLRRLRNRIIMAASLVITVVIAGLGLFAYRLYVVAEEEKAQIAEQKQMIEEQKAISEAERQQAREAGARARDALRLAAARQALGTDPTEAIALLREMEAEDPTWDSLGWHEAVYETLARPISLSVLGSHDDHMPVNAAAFSPDGKRVVTGSQDGSVKVWSVDGRSEPVELKGHRGLIHSVQFSPDSTRVVTSSADGEARVWSADGSTAPIVLQGHEQGVNSAMFSPDGQRVVTASGDNTARVWNANGTGAPIVLTGHQGSVESAVFSPDGARVLTVSGDNTARVWSASGDRPPVVLRGHTRAVWSGVFSPDGARVLTGSGDGTARVWNADGTGAPIILRGHGNWVHAVFSPDGTRVLTASSDSKARIWSADGRGRPSVLDAHQAWVWTAQFSPDGARILTASVDGVALLWDADGASTPIALTGHTARIWSASFSADGAYIVTASDDSTARVWAIDRRIRPIVIRTHDSGAIVSIALTSDGDKVATASEDGTLRIWNTDGTGASIVVGGNASIAKWLAFSPDGAWLAAGWIDGTAQVWNVAQGGQPTLFKGHETSIQAVDFSPDGSRLLTGSADGTARVWNVKNPTESIILKGHTGPIRAARFSPDGARVVTASDDHTARIWSVLGQGEPVVLRGHTGPVVSAMFSSDGARVVTGSHDSTARVWSADGAGTPVVLTGHDNPVLTAALSRDGSRVVTASEDHTVRVWRADGSGDPIILRGHEGSVLYAEFSPDGERVLTASHDSTARIWRVDGTGHTLVLIGHDKPLHSALHSQDGTHVATASEDGSLRIWHIESERLMARLWQLTSHCLGEERRREYLGASTADARKHYKQCRAKVRGDTPSQ